MDPVSLTAVITSIGTAFVAVYVAIRKQRAVDRLTDADVKKHDTELTEEQDATTIGQWRAIVRNQNRQHKEERDRDRAEYSTDLAQVEAEMKVLRTAAEEARAERDECRLTAARQEITIAYLRQQAEQSKQDIGELRQIMTDNGLWRASSPGSGTQQSLPPSGPGADRRQGDDPGYAGPERRREDHDHAAPPAAPTRTDPSPGK